eukprot:TRINITY_DN3599_c0_g1_i2.p1 TRINITY_DN3599_c0_g1~~TRINITY_DN3599_c0_g1_i2.p1  ORF type:complete len:699 (+),score=92.83 TRINITY_DN3599_c0_g1_i2:130-2226(+)
MQTNGNKGRGPAAQNGGAQRQGGGKKAAKPSAAGEAKPKAKRTSANGGGQQQGGHPNNKNSTSATTKAHSGGPQQHKNNKIVIPTTTVATSTPAPVDSLPLGEDKGLCLTCCAHITVYALGSCNHRDLCWLCFFRRRALYNQMDCCLCKQPLDVGVFTHNESPFSELPLSEYVHDKKHGLYYENPSLGAQVTVLFEFRCPACPQTAPTTCTTLPLLKAHLKQAHGLAYCEVCLQGRKAFLNEQKTFTPPDLERHKKGVGLSDQERHQYCEFCRTFFYDKEDIYTHLTMRHEVCHVCERDGIRYHYYRNYSSLEQHYRKEHYLCEDPTCLAQKFVVFKTALDFKAHQVNVHLDRSNLSKAELRAARTVDASILFAQDRPGSNGRNDNGGRRRGRDEDRVMIFSPLLAPPGANSAAPISNNAASTNTPTYVPTPVPTDSATTSSTSTNGDAAPEAGQKKNKQDKRRGRPPEPPPVSFQSKVEQEIREAPVMSEEERAQKNRELVERIQKVLTPQRFEDFRKLSSDLRGHRITPVDYYRRFLNTFPSHVAGEIFVDLVNLLPDPVLRAALLTLHAHAQSHPDEWETQGPGESTREDDRARQEAWELERLREKQERAAAAQSSAGAGWRPVTQRTPTADEFPSLSVAQKFSPRDYEDYDDSSYYEALVHDSGRSKDRFHNTSGGGRQGKKAKQKGTTLLRFG